MGLGLVEGGVQVRRRRAEQDARERPPLARSPSRGERAAPLEHVVAQVNRKVLSERAQSRPPVQSGGGPPRKRPASTVAAGVQRPAACCAEVRHAGVSRPLALAGAARRLPREHAEQRGSLLARAVRSGPRSPILVAPRDRSRRGRRRTRRARRRSRTRRRAGALSVRGRRGVKAELENRMLQARAAAAQSSLPLLELPR